MLLLSCIWTKTCGIQTAISLPWHTQRRVIKLKEWLLLNPSKTILDSPSSMITIKTEETYKSWSPLSLRLKQAKYPELQMTVRYTLWIGSLQTLVQTPFALSISIGPTLPMSWKPTSSIATRKAFTPSSKLKGHSQYCHQQTNSTAQIWLTARSVCLASLPACSQQAKR